MKQPRSPRAYEPTRRRLAVQALEQWYAHEVYLGRATYADGRKVATPPSDVPDDQLRGPDLLRDRRRQHPDWYKRPEAITAHGVASRNSQTSRQPHGEGMTLEVRQRQEQAEEQLNGRVRDAVLSLQQEASSYHSCVLWHLSGRSLGYMATQLGVQKPRAAEMLECGITWVLARLTVNA